MHICVTHVDAATGVPCDVTPMRKGPAFPKVKGLVLQWFNQSEWPTDRPLFYGTCDAGADLTVAGIVALPSEQEYNTLWDTEKAAVLKKTRAAINAERDRRLAADFTFNGKQFQRDATSLARITGAATLAGFAVAQGSPAGNLRWANPARDFEWIASDDTRVPMDAQTAFDFGAAAARVETTLVFAGSALRAMSPIPADFTDDKWWT